MAELAGDVPVTASGILLAGPETLLTALAGTFPDRSHQLSSLIRMSPRVSQQSDTSRTIHSAEQPTRIRCQGLSTSAYHSRAGQIWRIRPVTRTRRIGAVRPSRPPGPPPSAAGPLARSFLATTATQAAESSAHRSASSLSAASSSLQQCQPNRLHRRLRGGEAGTAGDCGCPSDARQQRRPGSE
jgi:hypothetical protein